jgi:hypothetical protein
LGGPVHCHFTTKPNVQRLCHAVDAQVCYHVARSYMHSSLTSTAGLGDAGRSEVMTFLYHLVPQPLIGDTLYPLNALKHHAPEAYTAHLKKYRGREVLLERTIPLLNCLWNDVLHFSPVHPAAIRDALLQVGFDWRPRDWFVVDPSSIGMTAHNSAIFSYPQRARGDFTLPASAFQPFSAAVLNDLEDLPSATRAYYHEAKAHTERPFLFHLIAHILYRGSIALEQMQTINTQSCDLLVC